MSSGNIDWCIKLKVNTQKTDFESNQLIIWNRYELLTVLAKKYRHVFIVLLMNLYVNYFVLILNIVNLYLDVRFSVLG